MFFNKGVSDQDNWEKEILIPAAELLLKQLLTLVWSAKNLTCFVNIR